jgi:hypothetical protein
MQYLSQVNDRELLGALRRSVLEIINGPNYDSRQVQNKIPTAQTVSLDSKNSLNISKDYVVSLLFLFVCLSTLSFLIQDAFSLSK